MKAINIQWDIDEESDAVHLPNEMEVPADITDEEDISDYLSEVTGFCHKGFQIEGENRIEQAATVERLATHPTEAIVLKYNFNDITPDKVRMELESIAAQFPNNIVLAIPDYLSLQSCSKDVLENIISMIAEIIDEL